MSPTTVRARTARPRVTPHVAIEPLSTPEIIIAVTTPTLPVVLVTTGGSPGPPGADGTLIHVGPTPPPSPALNALWVDTS